MTAAQIATSDSTPQLYMDLLSGIKRAPHAKVFVPWNEDVSLRMIEEAKDLLERGSFD